MKLVLVLSITLLAGCASFRRQSVVSNLRSSDQVEGSAIAFDGHPGRFAVLFERLRTSATDDDVEVMIRDSSAPVRLAGYLLACERWPQKKDAIFSKADQDLGEVTFLFGCDPFGERSRLGPLVRNPERVILNHLAGIG